MANPETIKNENQIGLNYLIRNQCTKELIEIALNRQSIQLNYQNSDGDAALHIAVEGCNKEIVDLLVQKGASVDIENNCHKTPISIVEEKLEIVSNTNDGAIWESIMCSLRLGKMIKSESISNEPTPSPTRKRPGSAFDDSIVERKRRKVKLHPAGGIRTSLHGVIFQLKLLMLFAQRAVTNHLGPFEMASEFNPAEKFDDIVFINQSTRFLQAKHKLKSEAKRITSKDLISTSNDDPFSLQKYFISFCKIKANKKWFGNSTLSDFIIITNADFYFPEIRSSYIPTHQKQHNDESDKLRGYLQLEDDLNEDKILYIENVDAKKYKLNRKDPNNLKKLMKTNLLNNALKCKIEIDDMKPIKELLTAIKIVHFEESIIEAKNLSEQLNVENTITKLSIEAKMILQCLENIYDSSRQKYVNLTNVRKELKNSSRTRSLAEIKSEVCVKAVELSDDAIKYLEDSKRKLEDYNSSESKEVVTLKNVEIELENIKREIVNAKDVKEIKQQSETPIFKTNVAKTFYSEILMKTASDNLEETKRKINEKLEYLIIEISIMRLVLCYKELDNLFVEFFNKFYFVTNYPNEKDLSGVIDAELSELCNLLQSDLVGAALERRMLDFLKYFKNGQAKFLTSEDIESFNDKLKGELRGLMASGLHQKHVDELKEYGIRFKRNPKALEEFIDPTDNKMQVFHLCTTTFRLSAIKALQTIESSTRYKECNSYILTSLKTLLIASEKSDHKQKEPQEIILHAFDMELSHSLLVIEFHEEADGENAKKLDLKRLFKSLSNCLVKHPSKKLILIAKSDSTFGDLVVRDELDDETFFRDLDEMSQTRVLEKEIIFQEKEVQLNKLIDETSADIVFDQEILSEFLNPVTKYKIGDRKAFNSIHYSNGVYINRQFHRNDGTVRDEGDFYKEESLKQKFVIVANEAGMGKSTVLTSIAINLKESVKHLWIVRLNLNDYKADRKKAKNLCRINFDENSTDEAIDFVAKMLSNYSKKKPLSRFQHKLFRLGLQISSVEVVRKPKIVVMFDGFDEVSRSIKEATTLIKALSKSEVVQIWVSTRVLKKLHLEEELESRAYALGPLSIANQIELSSNLWKYKLKKKESINGQQFVKKTFKEILDSLNKIELPTEEYAIKLRNRILKIQQDFPLKKRSKKEDLLSAIDALDFSEYIEKLKDHWKVVESVEGGNLSFTTNPLHLKMLTEVIYEKKFKLPENFGLLNLYDEFVKIKFQIFYKIKGGAGDYEAMEDSNLRDSENLRNIHCGLSVKVFADKATCKTLPNLHFKCENKQEFDRIGFLTLNETEEELEFIHRSYAEFFCSNYLIDNLQHKRVQKLAKNLVNDDNKLLSHFFEKNTKQRELKEKLFPDRLMKVCT